MNQTDQDYYEKLFETTRLITGLYLLPFISLFGIIGSFFNIIIYKNSQKYSTNVYLIALSISDIIKLINDFMYFLVSLIERIDHALGNKIFNIMYLYSHYIFVLTAINTAWLTCSIAMDRYVTLLNKNGKQKNGKYFISVLISIFIALLSAIIAIPSPLFLTSINEVDPSTNKTVAKVAESELTGESFKKFYSYFIAMFRAFIPFFIITYLNFKIIRIVYTKKMNKSRKKINLNSKNNNYNTTTTNNNNINNNSNNNNNKQVLILKDQKSNSKISLMLILIVLTFTVCMFPDAIMTMMKFGYANDTYLVRSVREITDLLLAINSSTTFPICYFFSIQYRAKFKELIFSTKKSKTDEDLVDYDEKTTFGFTRPEEKESCLNIKNMVTRNSCV